MKLWAKRLLWCSGTSIEVVGMENIVPNEKYIYLPNHTNLIDIPILFAAIPDDLHFMYRLSLQKIPILGLALRSLPFIPIIRENSKNAVGGIAHAAQTIKEHGSVVLFPEGTRSYNGKLDKFKRGAFALAEQTGNKIVPVTIRGVANITPQGGIKINKGEVLVTINKPITDIPADRTEMRHFIDDIHNMMFQQLMQ
ncbi:MAG: 1-acyl-sn-glycerol-3-phosphate acyltransferase [Ignavibacteria bacterium]|nr:1-acyl-sn-glycerol-3-phosphate acyltransferase [Ignavibacteria bacterium]